MHFSKQDPDGTTKKNVYESLYLLSLCDYLISQGYKSEEITILTTYNGQLTQFNIVSCTKNKLQHAISINLFFFQDRKKFTSLKKIRITAVDNFQGEENKIILLSLVRSNTNKNIGYLAFKNRICVALSRAQHGLYIIGNMSILSQASNIWSQINIELNRQKAIGQELELICSRHQVVQKVSRIKSYV